MKVQGTVFKYGNDVDTDVIIPARYLNTTSEAELASHCMEDIDKEFVKNVKQGDIMVAEDNSGCGPRASTRPIAIKASGISLVICQFFRTHLLPQFYQYRAAHSGMSRGGGEHQGGRRGFLRPCQGPHRKRDDGQDLSGGAFPRLYSEHHRQRRPDQIHSKQIIMQRRQGGRS